jgi:hypothetical protein
MTFPPTDFTKSTAAIAPGIWTVTLEQQDGDMSISDIQKDLGVATEDNEAPISAFLTLKDGRVTRMSLVRNPARIMQPRVASEEDCISIQSHFMGKGWKEAPKDSSAKPYIRACLALR